jgi:hypothetical protein
MNGFYAVRGSNRTPTLGKRANKASPMAAPGVTTPNTGGNESQANANAVWANMREVAK